MTNYQYALISIRFQEKRSRPVSIGELSEVISFPTSEGTTEVFGRLGETLSPRAG